MNVITFLLSTAGLLFILAVAFFAGAVYEDQRAAKAWKEGRPHQIGGKDVRITAWEDAQGGE